MNVTFISLQVNFFLSQGLAFHQQLHLDKVGLREQTPLPALWSIPRENRMRAPTPAPSHRTVSHPATLHCPIETYRENLVRGLGHAEETPG